MMRWLLRKMITGWSFSWPILGAQAVGKAFIVGVVLHSNTLDKFYIAIIGATLPRWRARLHHGHSPPGFRRHFIQLDYTGSAS